MWRSRAPLIGAALGLLLPLGSPLGPELVHRLRWALGGGRGETAVWGEPLFYILAAGIPLGLVGFLAGLILRRYWPPGV